MSGFFARFFRIVQVETNTALARFEDPVRMSEQGVRELKSSLSEAVISLAQVKSVAIRTRKEAQEETRRAETYEHKAVALLKRAQSGELAHAEADRLASEMLRRKGAADARAGSLAASAEQQAQLAEKLQSRIGRLKRDISRYEGELTALRARSTTARSVKHINQQLAGSDGSSTVAMLERMREKVAGEEALAEAYEQIHDLGDSDTDIEREVDRALAETSDAHAESALADLKAQLGVR